jgi:hypothetical protein
MSIATLSGRNLKLTMLLQIDGLAECFYLGPVAPPAPTHAGLGAVAYTVHPGLDSVGSVGSSLSLTEAVPSAARVSLRVGIGPSGAARALLRLSPGGAATSATLTDSLPATQAVAPLVVQCADAVAGFVVPGLAWIGREAVYISARDPVALTVTIATGGRGQLGTLIEPHSASNPMGWAPRLYSSCVSWRRRRARVWVGQLTPAGAWLTPPVVEAEGWMPTAPAAIGPDVVGLEIETLPAALDVEVGAPATAETGLQAGWHVFDGINGNQFDVTAQVWAERAAYHTRPPAWAAIGDLTYAGAPGALFIPLGGVFAGSAWSTYPAYQGLIVRAQADPRPAYLASAASGADGPDDPSGTITVSPGLPWPTEAFTFLGNARAEIRPVLTFGTPGVPEAIEWHPAAAFNAGLSAIPAAGWASYALDASGMLTLTPLWTLRTPLPLAIRWLAPTTNTCWALMVGTDMPRLKGGQVYAETWPKYAPQGRADRADRQPRGSAAIPAEYTLGAADTLHIQLGGIAAAWWQPPERYLLVAGDIVPGASPGSPKAVLIVHEAAGETRRTAMQVIGSQAADAITPGAVGFALEVAPASRSGYAIADLADGTPAVIRAVAYWGGHRVGRIARELATSVAGAAVNGPADVQPYGAAVPSALIDGPSFAAITDGPAGARTVLIDEGATPRALLSSLARSVGALVVERLDQSTGRRRLAMVPSGLPTPFEATGSIGDGDWLVDGRPTMAIDEVVINRIEFALSTAPRLSFGRDLPEGAEYTVSVTDRDSVGEQGAAATESIDLIGVQVNAGDALALRDLVLPLATQRFSAYGYPRRQVSGVIAYGRGCALDAGAVVRLAGAEMLGYDGQPLGSGGALGRLTSVTRDVQSQTCAITATYWQAPTAGWAPAMRVSFVAGSVLTVQDNYYSPTSSVLGIAQTDSSFFRVGDSVLCVPRGNRTSATVLTITAIAGAAVTLSGAPPAGMALGSVRLASYALATVDARAHCFLADAALAIPLPVGSDPAQRYT